MSKCFPEGTRKWKLFSRSISRRHSLEEHLHDCVGAFMCPPQFCCFQGQRVLDWDTKLHYTTADPCLSGQHTRCLNLNNHCKQGSQDLCHTYVTGYMVPSAPYTAWYTQHEESLQTFGQTKSRQLSQGIIRLRHCQSLSLSGQGHTSRSRRVDISSAAHQSALP